MQNNQQNYFGVPPNSIYSGGMGSQGQNLTPQQPPLSSVADQSSYAMIGMLGNMLGVRPSMPSSLPTSISVPSSVAPGSSDHVAQMYANMMRQMPGNAGPSISQPQWPGMTATPAATQRDATAELLRQFQMHRSSPEVLPNTVPLQAQQQPTAGSAADMPLLLAQAMSVPLATAFIQSMFACNPQPQVVQPAVFPAAGAGAMNPLLQLMQKAMQPAAPPVIPVVTPGVSPILPSAPVPAVSHRSSPAPTPSTSGLQIQLPPMDTSVAKALLLQLAEQLQRAGQLPNDDSFKKLLRSVQNSDASPASSATSSATTPAAVKTEIKAEPVSDPSYERKPQLPIEAKIPKKEPGTEKPICVVSNTQGSSGKLPSQTVETKAMKKPGVYIDVAEPAQIRGGSDSENDDVNFPDDSSSDSESRPLANATSGTKTLTSLKEPQAKMKKPGPKCNEVLASRPSSSGSTQRKSHGMYNYCDGVKYDCNIKLRKCVVKLKRLDMEKYLESKKSSPAASVTPPPVKEKDRVALLKQHKFSSAALLLPPLPAPVSSVPGSSQPIATKTEFMPPGSVLFGQPNRNVPVTLGSSGQSRIQTPASLLPVEMKLSVTAMGKPESLLSSSSSTVTSVSNLSIVKNDTTWNRNVGLGRSSTQMMNTPLVPLKVTIKPSINASANHQLRSMYMGLVASNMEWLSLVSCTRGTGKQQYCQCIFCPAVGDMPRDVALHINASHAELSWALSKLKPSAGSLLYINCRHCDFVTVEPTVLWIHFEIHHDVSGILDSNCPAKLDLSKPDPPMQMVNLDENLPMVSSFVCIDCGAVNTDFDTTAGSMAMARHIVRDHPHTANFNGCFVKLIMLQRVEGDPDSIKGSVTYRQAIYEKEHVRGRRDVFVCMLCRYSAFCSYLALSHSVSSHQTKRMLYVCSECSYQCLSDSDAVQHMTREHRRRSPVSSSLVCSATLVDRTASGDGYVECPVTVNRASSLNLVTAQAPAPSTDQPTTPSATTKNVSGQSKKQKAKKTKDSDSDDEDEPLENVKRKRKHRRTQSRSNSVDSDTDVVPSKKKIKRKRQASESSGTSATNDSDCAASSKLRTKAKSKSRRSADLEEDDSDAESRKQSRSAAAKEKKPMTRQRAPAKEDSDEEGEEERKRSLKLQSTKISSSEDKVRDVGKKDSARSVSVVDVDERSQGSDGKVQRKSTSNPVWQEKLVDKERVNSEDMMEATDDEVVTAAVAMESSSTITSDKPSNDKQDIAKNVTETVAELPASADTCDNARNDLASCRERVTFGDDLPSTTENKTGGELNVSDATAAAETVLKDMLAQNVLSDTAALVACDNNSVRSADLSKVTD